MLLFYPLVVSMSVSLLIIAKRLSIQFHRLMRQNDSEYSVPFTVNTGDRQSCDCTNSFRHDVLFVAFKAIH